MGHKYSKSAPVEKDSKADDILSYWRTADENGKTNHNHDDSTALSTRRRTEAFEAPIQPVTIFVNDQRAPYENDEPVPVARKKIRADRDFASRARRRISDFFIHNNHATEPSSSAKPAVSVEKRQSLNSSFELPVENGCTVRRARLAEPEPSISDSSESGRETAPSSPSPVPAEVVNASAAFRRQSSADSVVYVGRRRSDSRSNASATLVDQSRASTIAQSIAQQPSAVPSRQKLSFFSSLRGDIRRRLNLRASLGGAEEYADTVSTSSAFTSEMDAMKSAFYNVTVFMMAVCTILGAAAAYYLFYEFVKPAMWAVICGIVLYPLKRQVTGVVRSWLDQLNETSTPLTFGIVALPLAVTNQIGELLLDSMTNNLKMVLLMIAAFPASALLLHFETIPRVLVTAKQLLFFVDHIVVLFNGLWVPVLFIAYLAYVCVSNLLCKFRNDYAYHAAVSWTIWTAAVAYACNNFGPFRTPLFTAIIVICSTYYMPLIKSVLSTHRFMKRGRSRKSSKRRGGTPGHASKSLSRSRSNTRFSEKDSSKVDGKAPPADVGEGKTGRAAQGSQNIAQPSKTNESNMYLKTLFTACFFVYVSLHLWMMTLLILPAGVAVLRRIIIVFDLRASLEIYWQKLRSALGGDTSLLLPPPLLHLFRVLIHIDSQVIYYLRQSMDLVGSLTSMVVLLIGVASVAGFLTFQLYYESMHLINLTADIANQTLTKNPGLQKWLRQTVHVESVTDLADEAVQRAYGMGRNWLTEQVHLIVQNDSEKANLLEGQIVTTLDTFFHSWLSKNQSINQTLQHKTAIAQWADVWTALGDSGTELDWNFFDNLQEYMSVMWSLADSAWSILKNNMEILMIGLSQIASTLFASGSAVINFFLDSIVFLTFLLYLLSESDEEYKPLKMIRDMVPGGRATASKITEQVEQAVNGVFLATLKMAVFYGMFTWLTHTLFAVNLVFIPSVLAAAFAAIPFFGTYLVALPAVLELWIIRGEPFLAVLLFVLHYIPSYVVDDEIYSEIKLTTPLLSGMAIAGGMLWWGLEGAIFGPLVLCCILVLGSVYKTIFFKTMSTGTSASSGSSTEGSANVEDPLARKQPKQHVNGDVKR